MSKFNFSKEMVYGKKHLQKININKDYNFISIVENLYNIELKYLHTKKEKEYELFTEIGKDSETEFHNKFYIIRKGQLALSRKVWKVIKEEPLEII